MNKPVFSNNERIFRYRFEWKKFSSIWVVPRIVCVPACLQGRFYFFRGGLNQ